MERVIAGKRLVSAAKIDVLDAEGWEGCHVASQLRSSIDLIYRREYPLIEFCPLLLQSRSFQGTPSLRASWARCMTRACLGDGLKVCKFVRPGVLGFHWQRGTLMRGIKSFFIFREVCGGSNGGLMTRRNGISERVTSL